MGKQAARRPASRTRKPAQQAAVPARTSVADALFTATQQRVLSLLFGQPERSFLTKELIDLAGGGTGPVQRELAPIQTSRWVGQTGWGNQQPYQDQNSKSAVEGKSVRVDEDLRGGGRTKK